MGKYKEFETDILVIGAGLAGIGAAFEAAKTDENILIAVSAKFCSGSSFYPGTWGLGIVTPLNQENNNDFWESINEIGCGISDKDLNYVLMENIFERVQDLEDMGIQLDKNRGNMIPCFDKKLRGTLGFRFENSKNVLRERLAESKIKLLEDTQIIKLIKDDKTNEFIGAIGVDKENNFICIYSKSVVIATGGFGGIYKHSLNTEDINGCGQVMAMEAGCELVNMEFIQFLPGYLSPCYKTAFNERVFNYCSFLDKDGNSVLENYLPEGMDIKDTLAKRAGHGPFTSRLSSQYVDIALFNEYLKDEDRIGTRIKYSEDIKKDSRVEVSTYFEWLKEAKGITEDTQIHIAPFEHAANGGIKINTDAQTNISGIYAAGEVSGGIHGADRIGGLATASALVFGKIAGKSAAQYSKKKELIVKPELFEKQIAEICTIKVDSILTPDEVIENIKEIMFRYGCIIRNKENLEVAIRRIKDMQKDFSTGYFIQNDYNIKKVIKAANFLRLSEAMLTIMLMRNESRGSHYRSDYPEQKNDFQKCIAVYCDKNDVLKYTSYEK